MRMPLFIELVTYVIISSLFFLQIDTVSFPEFSIEKHQPNKHNFNSNSISITSFIRQLFGKFNTDIGVTINGIMVHCSFSYILCYYANVVTLCGLQVAQIIYNNFRWYRLHLKNQRITSFWLHRSQKTFYLDANGIVNCSMGTFLAVRSKL